MQTNPERRRYEALRGTACSWMAAVLTIAILGVPAVAGAQVSYQVVHVFAGGAADGQAAFGAVIEGTDGNFYGTTQVGGAFGLGTAFRMTPGGSVTVLYSFAGGSDGALPYGTLVRGKDGNFYGTTTRGGSADAGTVYRITPDGSYTLMHSFTVFAGQNPYAPLIQGTDGNLYGVSLASVIFKITPAGAFTILHTLGGGEGQSPFGALVEASDGNFYGTTRFGTVYRVSPSGAFGVLHQFDTNTEGTTLNSALVQGPDGNFYGTARNGGVTGGGTVFRITPAGAVTVLHAFTGGADGDGPEAGLILAPDGNFYGTTAGGFASTARSRVFRIAPDGTFTVLYTFTAPDSPPYASLLLASDGNLYGTTTGLGGGRSVVFRVSTGPITLSRSRLQFGGINAGGTLTATSAQTVLVTPPAGAGWTATPNVPWIDVSPTSGSAAGIVTVSVVDRGGVLPAAGALTGAVVFRPTIGTAIATLPVGLTLSLNGTTGPAFGILDTPADGSTGVTGSIAVTGWALDDLEVRQVRILRDPVAGEGTAPIFIGTAVLVDGSRPDVAALYPTTPRSTRAGWGYLLLTNFLPNLGNGTFKLYAIADDADGHSTTLGSRTITCANSTSTQPFGAIDTPAQGETISGTSYSNFGWVLVRGPARADPPSGTVSVAIDGVLGASPTGWGSRSDLTALFPAATYPGVTNALGIAALDTTALANGVHTIAWVVTANNGQADGVGSRYFAVANGVSAVAAGIRDPESGIRHPGSGVTPGQINAAPLDVASIIGRRGYDLEAAFSAFAVSPSSGRATIQGEELDRFELQLGAADRQLDTETYTGYMRIGDELGPLPIGSHLDPATGVFTWQPGVGFVHAYDLVFGRSIAGLAIARQEVRIVLNPKGSSRVGPQVVIDVPWSKDPGPRSTDPGLQVQQPFVVAGWAIDPDDLNGTGVDTLHVWAYPRNSPSADPIFLGATAYGGARPDVAAIFGDRFRNSGYSLTVDGLAPGVYDVAVFAWSTAQNRFVPAKVVRVTVR